MTAFRLLVAALLGAPTFLAAQGTVQVNGRVATLRGGDTVAVPNARVTLHKVGREVQGPADSTLADAQGRFRFAFPRDTTALHLVSARRAGIEYFSTPIGLNPDRPAAEITLVVHDTSTTAPITLDGRNLVIGKPGDDGARPVLELLVLRNAGDLARVAPDTVTPSWGMPLPSPIVGFQVGPGDISAEAVLPRGDSVLVFAPLAPGDKQLVYQYGIPGDRQEMTIPFGVAVENLVVLLEEGETETAGIALTAGAVDTVQGKAYRRYSGSAKAGDRLVLRWPDPRAASRRTLGLLVGLLALGVGAVTWWAVRRRRPAPRLVPVERPLPPPVVAVPVAEDLVAQIAALDAMHAGKQAELSADAWAAYVAERERLVAQALGGRPPA